MIISLLRAILSSSDFFYGSGEFLTTCSVFLTLWRYLSMANNRLKRNTQKHNLNCDDLSTLWNTLPNTKEEVLTLLQTSPCLYGSYQSLNEDWKQHFLDFCQGKKFLPLTYDPFFKRIFHPDIHPDHLSRFISSIMGITVKVLHILPSEDLAIHGESLLIMDLLAESEDGSLINVEIQKQ